MAYKALVNKYHPDRNPECEKSLHAMQIINASYDVLRDPIKRKDHDFWIKRRLAELEAAKHNSNIHVGRTQPEPQASRHAPPQQTYYPKPQPPPKKKDNSGCGCLSLLLIAGVFLALFGGGKKTNYTPSSSYSSTAAKPLPQAVSMPSPFSIPTAGVLNDSFSEPIQPLPKTGELSVKANYKVIAPFEIKTKEGGHYLVKLADSDTGKDVLTVFVRGGETANVKAPLGKYIVKYASGDKWYGYDHLFGPSTEYSKADDIFDFTREISSSAASRLTELNRQLMIADAKFRQYLVSQGLPQKNAAYMFDGSDPATNEQGIDRFDNKWWDTTILAHVKNNARTYNAIVDRLNARNHIANERNALRARSESVSGYTITLYKVRDGNLRTKQIDKSEF